MRFAGERLAKDAGHRQTSRTKKRLMKWVNNSDQFLPDKTSKRFLNCKWKFAKPVLQPDRASAAIWNPNFGSKLWTQTSDACKKGLPMHKIRQCWKPSGVLQRASERRAIGHATRGAPIDSETQRAPIGELESKKVRAALHIRSSELFSFG